MGSVFGWLGLGAATSAEKPLPWAPWCGIPPPRLSQRPPSAAGLRPGYGPRRCAPDMAPGPPIPVRTTPRLLSGGQGRLSYRLCRPAASPCGSHSRTGPRSASGPCPAVTVTLPASRGLPPRPAASVRGARQCPPFPRAGASVSSRTSPSQRCSGDTPARTGRHSLTHAPSVCGRVGGAGPSLL